MSSLHKKIVKVMESVSRIKKNGYNSFHKYAYVTEADVIESVKDELVKNNLTLTHSVKSYTQIEDVMTMLVDFTITDAETGESTTSTAIGSGQDRGDKAPYKALTGAMKYYLMKSLLIPTGDDPEATTNEGKSTAPRASAPMKETPGVTTFIPAEVTKKPVVSFSKKALAKPAAPTTGDDI